MARTAADDVFGDENLDPAPQQEHTEDVDAGEAAGTPETDPAADEETVSVEPSSVLGDAPITVTYVVDGESHEAELPGELPASHAQALNDAALTADAEQAIAEAQAQEAARAEESAD